MISQLIRALWRGGTRIWASWRLCLSLNQHTPLKKRSCPASASGKGASKGWRFNTADDAMMGLTRRYPQEGYDAHHTVALLFILDFN